MKCLSIVTFLPPTFTHSDAPGSSTRPSIIKYCNRGDDLNFFTDKEVNIERKNSLQKVSTVGWEETWYHISIAELVFDDKCSSTSLF